MRQGIKVKPRVNLKGAEVIDLANHESVTDNDLTPAPFDDILDLLDKILKVREDKDYE